MSDGKYLHGGPNPPAVIAFVAVHTKYSRRMGPWLGHTGHWLTKCSTQAGLAICYDVVGISAFQNKGSLGVIAGWVSWHGSLHRQRGLNSTPNTQGQIWRPLSLLAHVHEVTLPLQRCVLASINKSFPLPLFILLGGSLHVTFPFFNFSLLWATCWFAKPVNLNE